MNKNNPYLEALQWQIEAGADEALLDESPDRTALPKVSAQPAPKAAIPVKKPTPLSGTPQAREEAIRLASSSGTIEELREALAGFEGLAVKKTATRMVFSDGNPQAPVMLVGEAPGADEDRIGKPFVGVSGQLLDRILACVGLDRQEEDPAKAVYISNILNWRPPGNRTPTPAEIDISLPFIERHIMLVNPKILILCGGVAAKALLGSGESISRLRKGWHDYRPLTAELGQDDQPPIPAIATYHPAFLLRTPLQKRAVWQDMLSVQEQRRKLGLLT